MAYVKTTWVDDSAPYICAENLNKIENGIYQSSVILDRINYTFGTDPDTNWVYKRYYDGTFEIWQTASMTIRVTTGAGGESRLWRSTPQNVPAMPDWVDSIELEEIQCDGYDWCQLYNIATGKFTMWSTTSGEKTHDVQFYVKGRWS